MSEKLPSSFTWRFAGNGAGKKQKIVIASKTGYTILAVGLYETSKDLATGESVDTFTLLTTTPTEHLGEVRDRAPLIMPPEPISTGSPAMLRRRRY